MMPVWKVKRELGRIVGQIRDIPRRLIEPVARKKYDRERWNLIKSSLGRRAQTPKVCLFFIYQKSGLPLSVVETASFLASHGYCVIVVANGGLPSGALAQLRDHVWQILERPNLGYDFGGYQDGIKYLNLVGVVPETLLILNDSIWFPLDTGTDVLQQLEASKYDLCGLMLHSPARNDEPSEVVNEERQQRLKANRKKAEHIESYVFVLKQATFLSKAFQSFWESYAWSNSKSLTIKRGEIGFSKHFAIHGKTVGAISSRHLFVERIAERDDKFLYKTLVYAAYSDADLAEERDALVAELHTNNWRKIALDHIERTVKRRRFNASFCYATEEIFNLGFVKKHNGAIFQKSRKKFLEAVDSGDLIASSPGALKEIREKSLCDKLT